MLLTPTDTDKGQLIVDYISIPMPAGLLKLTQEENSTYRLAMPDDWRDLTRYMGLRNAG